MNAQSSAQKPAGIGVAGRVRPAALSDPDFVEQARQWVTLILLTSLTYLLLSRFVLQVVQVQGQSMTPTLQDAQCYLLNRWVYYLHPPIRGDVVVLRDPSDGEYAVKRVVALSGDAVYLKHGRIYVNGLQLKEPYLAPRMPTYTDSKVDEELILCGREQYFVLGDNRNNSYDSRVYGPIHRRNIVGALIQ
jgi:signal peptidase I